MIAIYSILHFIVDAICAFGMFGRFGNEGLYAYLFYNLCAFVLQLPAGAIIDLIMMKLSGDIAKKRFNLCVTILGVVLALIGMYAGPLVLGVGNALFHSGGGVSCIIEDRSKSLNGRGLGVFVAPGALGLFIGKLVSGYAAWMQYVRIAWIVISVVVVIIAILIQLREENVFSLAREGNNDGTNSCSSESKSVSNDKKKLSVSIILFTVICCFGVVIIRSYVGLAMSFEWKTGIVMALLAVLMVALGKAAGGFAAASFGRARTICISLGLAAVAFGFSDIAICGLFALFFFNMTMPITLHMMTEMLSDTPGIAFGSLSLGLFIGFVPVCLAWSIPITGVWIGVSGSIISLAVLMLPILTTMMHNKRKE